VFTEELIDSVIAVLKGGDGSAHTGGLPANWWEDGNDGLEVVLKLLEHGDVADYPGADALEAARTARARNSTTSDGTDGTWAPTSETRTAWKT